MMKLKVFYHIMMVENFAFVDYFAIDGNQKGKGLGSKMLKHFMETAGKPVILEVEHPEDEQSRHGLRFIKEMA